MAFALRAGQSAGLVFSLSRFARRWRGTGFLFRSNGLRSARARWWRGGCFFLRSNGFALRAGQRQGGVFRIPPPYLWTPLSPQRVKGCSPLTIPKMRSKPKNASRFAKRIFLCFSHLRLRRRFHVSAGRYRQQRGNTSCEAANRRNEKKALSAATSFFPFRQPLWGLKGASSPFLATATTAACGGNREELLGPRSAGHECRPRHEVDAGYRNPSGPARRNRWWFSGSLLTSKENISLNEKALCPAHRRATLVLFWFSFGTQKRT